MTSYEVVPYGPEHRAGLFGLMRAVWGSYMGDEEFDWWYERNPVRRGTITLALGGGAVVGVLAMSYARMLLDGQERVAAFAIDGATHPEWRGRGIFQALEAENDRRAAEEGAAVAVGFTNPQAGPILVGRSGWSDVRRLRLWARPYRPLALARRGAREMDPADGLPPPDPRPISYGDVHVEPLDAFGADERFAGYARAAYPDHVVRDTAYLDWRYGESPRGYRRFGAYRDGDLRGFAVLGHKLHAGVSAGYVADLVAPPADGLAVRALLRRSVHELRGGADALIALPPPVATHRRAFLSVGFVPTPMTIRLIGKPLAPDARLPDDGGRWHFSLGDSDVF